MRTDLRLGPPKEVELGEALGGGEGEVNEEEAGVMGVPAARKRQGLLSEGYRKKPTGTLNTSTSSLGKNDNNKCCKYFVRVERWISS